MPFAETLTALGTALGGASSIAGAVSGLTSLRKSKKYADYTDRINDENYAKQLRDTERLLAEDREYNSYANVAARAREAGINPLAVIGNGSAGVQQMSQTVPSQSPPTASASDWGASALVSAGSTLTAQARQLALLKEEIREAKANADIREIESFWKDKEYRVDIAAKEAETRWRESGIPVNQATARHITLIGDFQEIKNKFAEAHEVGSLYEMANNLRQQALNIRNLEVRTAHAEEFVFNELAGQVANVWSIYETVRQRGIELEQNWKQLGLTESQLKEVKDNNLRLDKLARDKMDWQSGEAMKERNFKSTENQKNRDWQSKENRRDRTCKYISTAADVVGTVASCMTGIGAVGAAVNASSKLPSWAEDTTFFDM